MKLVKMSGAGNTFHVVDLRDVDRNSDNLESVLSLGPKLAREHCAVTLDGADGFIFLKPSEEADFAWDFYNSDGSLAEMCGNAARCVSKLVFDSGIGKKEISFMSGAGKIETKIKDAGLVEVLMTTPFSLENPKKVVLDDKEVIGLFVNTGVPHFVFETKEESFDALKETARKIQFHGDFKPSNTNVTLVRADEFEEVGGQRVPAVTFERGVEDYTQACGTGAVAAGIFLVSNGKAEFDEYIDIQMPGGQLSVKIGDQFKSAFLLGPAEYIGNIEFDLN